MDASSRIDTTWLVLPPGNPFAGRTLAEVDLRARTGASVVAILRNKHLMPNPESTTAFEAGDRIGLICDPEHIGLAEKLLSVSDS